MTAPLPAPLPRPCVPDTSAATAPSARAGAALDLQRVSFAELQRAMAAGLPSATLVRTYRARVAELDGDSNSVLALSPTAEQQAEWLDAERSSGVVRGPLHGIPVLLKDNIGTADQPTTAGARALEGLQPHRNAFLVTRLRDAGAIVLGKTNLSEWANWVDPAMPNGWSGLGGQVRAAFGGGDPSGSSSGSAVAAALGLAAATIGSETSGSILSPSSVAAIVGVKPTRGLVSRAGIVPLAEGFDTAGPMARTVADAAALLTVLAGSDPEDPATADADAHRTDYVAALAGVSLQGARLGLSPALRDGLDAPRRAVYEAALTTLSDAGAVLVETAALDEATALGTTLLGLIPASFRTGLQAYLAEQAPPPPSGVRTLADVVAFNDRHPDAVPHGQALLVASVSFPGEADEVGRAAAALRAVQARAIEAAMEGLDALIAPGAEWANLGASAGCPGVVVPAGMADGQPLGLCFHGEPWSEARLLGLAAAFEAVAAPRQVPAGAHRAAAG